MKYLNKPLPAIDEIKDTELLINSLEAHKFKVRLDAMEKDIRNDFEHIKYLDLCTKKFVIMKDVMTCDAGLQSLSSSAEAATTMSESAKNTMQKILDYIKEFFKWADMVLLVTLKNTIRISNNLQKVLKTQGTKEKLANRYETKDLPLEEYKKYLKSIMDMNRQLVDSIEDLRNVNKQDAEIEATGTAEQAEENTEKESNFITEFQDNKQNEQKQLDPSQGHWFDESYLQQLNGTFQECIASIQSVKRTRASINQIINSMQTVQDTDDKKANNAKLTALKDLFLDKVKTNLGEMSKTVIYLGKKIQTILKSAK